MCFRDRFRDRVLDLPEHVFETVRMVMAGRQDIIGDLFRLHRQMIDPSTDDPDRLLGQLEILAAVAVTHGMSHNIVAKASGIPRERVDAVLDHHAIPVRDEAAQWERKPVGVVVRKDAD